MAEAVGGRCISGGHCKRSRINLLKLKADHDVSSLSTLEVRPSQKDVRPFIILTEKDISPYPFLTPNPFFDEISQQPSIKQQIATLSWKVGQPWPTNIINKCKTSHQ